MQIGKINNINFGRLDRRSAQIALDEVSQNPIRTRQVKQIIMEQAFNAFYDITEQNGKWLVNRTNAKPDIDYPFNYEQTHDTLEQAAYKAQEYEKGLKGLILNGKALNSYQGLRNEEFLDKFTINA